MRIAARVKFFDSIKQVLVMKLMDLIDDQTAGKLEIAQEDSTR